MEKLDFKILSKNTEDIDKILNYFTKIHHAAYSKEHFTSLFSDEKLNQYYKLLIYYSDLSIMIYSNDIPLGFIVSGKNVSLGVKEFKKLNKFYLSLLLVLNPIFFIEKLKAILIVFFSKNHVNTTEYRLLSIAVDNKNQSKGIGNILLTKFEDFLIERSILTYGLSVRKDNARAIKFYLNNGFEIEIDKKETLYLKKNIK